MIIIGTNAFVSIRLGNPDKTLQQCGLDLYPAALLHHLPGVPVDTGKDR